MILRFRTYDIVAEEDLVDNGVVVYAAAVTVGGPAIARRPSLHTRGGTIAVPADAVGNASSILSYSSINAFGAYGIEIERPPWPGRVAGDVDIVLNMASVTLVHSDVGTAKIS